MRWDGASFWSTIVHFSINENLQVCLKMVARGKSVQLYLQIWFYLVQKCINFETSRKYEPQWPKMSGKKFKKAENSGNSRKNQSAAA